MAITGPFKPFHLAKLLVAGSSTFQGLCGVGTATEALEYIEKWYGQTQELPPPRCLVLTGDNYGKLRSGIGHFRPNENQVLLQFEFYVPPATEASSYEEEGDWVMSQVGAICNDMETAHNNRVNILNESPLDLKGWVLYDGPQIVETEEIELVNPDSGQENRPHWATLIALMLGG